MLLISIQKQGVQHYRSIIEEVLLFPSIEVLLLHITLHNTHEQIGNTQILSIIRQYDSTHNAKEKISTVERTTYNEIIPDKAPQCIATL